jgi:UDP-3-O-[3-hydroxymyristoyl] glucosamine N-acyltransferase
MGRVADLVRWHRARLVFAAVFLAPPPLKKVLLRIGCGARVAPTARIGWFAAVVGRRVVIEAHARVGALTLIRCDGDVSLGRHAEVSSFVVAYGAGGLSLGDHAYVGPQSWINCDGDVRIGDGSALGPRTTVFTHGSFLPYTRGYPARIAGVSVGDRTWIAAQVFLHPGVHVGDDAFVNACAVVTRDVAARSVVEGTPAREVFPIDRLRRPMTPARMDAAVRTMLARFVDMELGARGVPADVESPDVTRFRWAGRPYVIRYVPDGTARPADEPGVRTIVLAAGTNGASHTGWSIDVAALRTTRPRDRIHGALVQFMLRYYGMHLDYRD